MPSDRLQMPSDRPLKIVLRCWGCLDLLALVAVVAPTAWLAWGHEWAGLGPFSEAPVVGYLARSASALYVLHGALILFISTDVRRYGPLISFLAAGSIVHGMVIIGIDWAVGMPAWWTRVEGAAFATGGVVVLLLRHGHWGTVRAESRRSERAECPLESADADLPTT
jgi:hypothetical protein